MASNDSQKRALYSLLISSLITKDTPMSAQEVNLVTQCLIQAGIPFDTAFAPATRKDAASLQMTIHVSPKTTIVTQIW